MFSLPAISQNIHESTDTTIVLDKELAKKLLEAYSKTSEIEPDLVPDNTKEWMVTDRPHVAETPFMVPRGYFQWETGFQIQKSKTDFNKTRDITYNTTLVRLGLSRRFEARFELTYGATKIYKRSNDSITSNINGLSGLTIGSKVFLFNEKGILPKGTLLYGFSLPFIGSKDFRPSYTAAEIKFLFLNRINAFYEVEYNIGIQWDGITKNAAYAYALNNEIELTHKLYCFAEVYGYFYENSDKDDRFDNSYTNDHRINGGFWYLFNQGIQLDLSAGFGLSKVSPGYYVAVGFSNRFSLRKKK